MKKVRSKSYTALLLMSVTLWTVVPLKPQEKNPLSGDPSLIPLAVSQEVPEKENDSAAPQEEVDTMQSSAEVTAPEKTPDAPVAEPTPTPTPQNTSPESQEASQPQVTQEVSPEESEGPDTISLPEEKIGYRGNWVKKREWLLRAKETIRKINENITACEYKRAPLEKEFNTIQNMLDAFYQETGVRIGNLQKGLEHLGYAPTSSPEEKALQGSSQVPVFEEFDEGVTLYQNIVTINSELAPIKNLDEALTKRIEKLGEQLDIVRSNEQQAQILYEEMWEMLDDTKAQTNFYQLKENLAQIKSIREYVEGDFSTDFMNTVETTQKQIVAFKEKLLDYEGTFKSIQQQATQKEAARKKQLEQEQARSQAWYIYYPKAFFSSIYSFFAGIIAKIKGIFIKSPTVPPASK